MSKFNKILLSITATIWFVILVLRIGASIDKKREREIYERGVQQTVEYHYCLGKYPSMAFRNEEWNLVNMPDDCRYVVAVDERLNSRQVQ